MFKKISLSVKMLIVFLVAGSIPFAIIGAISLDKTTTALREQSFNELRALREIKKGQIERFFQRGLRDVALSSESSNVHALYDILVQYHQDKNVDAVGEYEVNSAEYKELWANNSSYLSNYVKEYGYDDLFLICAKHGHVMFTASKEKDLGTNLAQGPFKDSGLARAWHGALDTQKTYFVDFTPYAPSGGKPAAFLANPLHNAGGEIVGVFALQLSLDAINRIMQQRDGMGETGETYLVGQDKLMRSDSFHDPENHTVVASFANPAKGSVDTEGAREALAGNTAEKIIIDYNGNRVLSAYTPIKVGDTTWAILAEIDEVEAFAAADTLQHLLMIVGLCGAMFLIGVALLLARNINNTVVNPIKRVIANLNSGAEQVSSAAGQVAEASQQLAEGASEQASSLEETSASLEEMASMTKQNADNATQADKMASEARDDSENGLKSMERMSDAIGKIKQSSDETAKILKTIDEIAFQTNLLALNAAVEAARAGDAGKGFAVVAEEVRRLAQRSAVAAKDTAALIEGAQQNANNGVTVAGEVGEILTSIGATIKKVSQLISEVAAASKEQSQGIDQVNIAISQVDRVTQSNAANSEEAASASEELSAQSGELNNLIATLATIIGGGGTQQNKHATPATHRAKKPRSNRPVNQHRETAAMRRSDDQALSNASRKELPHRPTSVSPEKVIPLDDSELEEF